MRLMRCSAAAELGPDSTAALRRLMNARRSIVYVVPYKT